MSTEREQGIPSYVRSALKHMGYTPDESMQAQSRNWWEWYTARAGWYNRAEEVNGRRFRVKRHTLHPARRVCREWASAILDDDGTKISTEDEATTELLDVWVSRTRFIPVAQRAIERAFATGTGALALWFDARTDGTVDIRARKYDARMILPLSWDDDGVTACAFVTRAFLNGKEVCQLQVHAIPADATTYHIMTAVFDAANGRNVTPESIVADFDSHSDMPTYAVLRPAIDNVFVEGTYMGQSVFADAMDAIRGVDNAFDSMQREIDATKVKVFMSDSLFDLADDGSGKPTPIPMSPENTVIRKVSTVEDMIEVFAPPIRTGELTDALNVALAQLGDLTGFGQQYFRYDKGSGLRTATEVSADNSAFMRTLRKHENELGPQLEGLLTALCTCQASLGDWPLLPGGSRVRVDFDDSIIQDTASEKAQMLAEVSAGIVPKWMYLTRFYALDEDTAKELTAEPEVIDIGA